MKNYLFSEKLPLRDEIIETFISGITDEMVENE
jgi:hypothetical protein